MHAAKPRLWAVALVAVATVTATSGCFGIVSGNVIVAASAPKASSGMTIFVAEQPGVLDRISDSRAEYAIYYGERLVYPLGGKGTSVPLDGLAGSVFVPYANFVVGNGAYDIVVTVDGDEHRARVDVQKWAEYVFLHPFDRGSTILVEVALGSATGGSPLHRVLTKGELILEIHYRGLQGNEDRTIGVVRAWTEHDSTSTRVDVPRSKLDAGPGYYSFEPVFHNSEAKNNVQVGPDPTMAHRSPPWNWIHITR